eukprot:scaffold3894_cov127-Isochrysis_galbana.AAC.1
MSGCNNAMTMYMICDLSVACLCAKESSSTKYQAYHSVDTTLLSKYKVHAWRMLPPCRPPLCVWAWAPIPIRSPEDREDEELLI